MERETKMTSCCINTVVVTGAVKDIAHFKQRCFRWDEMGQLSFDFNSLIPMPAIIKGTVAGRSVRDALVVLGRTDLVENPDPLEERMKYWNVSDIEALKEKIGPNAFENARQSIEAFEQTGAPNWYVWANRNWGTKSNASDFKIISTERERCEFYFYTDWSPPKPVYVKLAEMFPNLCFEINGWDYYQLNFDFQATVGYGAFNIQYDDPNRKGFQIGTESDRLLNFAKSYGNDQSVFFVWVCVNFLNVSDGW